MEIWRTKLLAISATLVFGASACVDEADRAAEPESDAAGASSSDSSDASSGDSAGASSGDSSGASSGDGSGESSGGTGTVDLMHGASNGQCVAEGMRFVEVFSCVGVLGPTPNEPPIAAAAVDHNPETLSDPDYEWVLAQAEACSCTCCHAQGGIGSYRWSHDFAPAWTDSADAQALGALGFTGGPNAFDPADNHGFSRSDSALPTTDASRLQAFVEREMGRRGGD